MRYLNRSQILGAITLNLVLLAWTSNALLAEEMSPPNVVLFIADDISQEDIGCYGHPTIKTPAIDQLAETGLRFDNAYLTTSSCSPSRCSLISGRYPHNTGAAELHTELPEGTVLFPKILRDHGYYSALSGKHHMGPWADNGFDLVSKGKGIGKEEDWVELVQHRPKGKPFFFWFASTDAHRPWGIDEATPVYAPADVVVPPYLIDGPETRKDLTGYYHEITRFDHYIGKVVEELKRQGVFENTVVIVMADNGRPFPRCKTRLYDSGIKTPLVMHYPKVIKAGSTKSLVSSIDLSATILDLAGAPADKSIQGVSVKPILSDHDAVVRELVFAEHNWHVFANHERMVRFGDWLYIKNNLPDQQNLCAEAYNGLAGKELWAAWKKDDLTGPQRNIFRNPCPSEELYNVKDDPDQLQNRADSMASVDVIAEMRLRLQDWSEQTGDTIPKKFTLPTSKPPNAPADFVMTNRKNCQRGEMPGAKANATQIFEPGPVKREK